MEEANLGSLYLPDTYQLQNNYYGHALSVRIYSEVHKIFALLRTPALAYKYSNELLTAFLKPIHPFISFHSLELRIRLHSLQ